MPNFGDTAANSTVPTGAFVGDVDTQTLTNKRVNPRSSNTSDPSTLTPASDLYDIITVIGQNQAMTINAPSGTPVMGQQLRLGITDNGSAQTLTFNAIYVGGSGVTIPATTLGSTTVSLILTFIYDSNLTKWRLISKGN